MVRPAVPATMDIEPASGTHRPFVRTPLATPAELLDEPAPFPRTDNAAPIETAFGDWRRRLAGNLSRRSDGRWAPLTYVHGRKT
jgi:hypothetical protein